METIILSFKIKKKVDEQIHLKQSNLKENMFNAQLMLKFLPI